MLFQKDCYNYGLKTKTKNIHQSESQSGKNGCIYLAFSHWLEGGGALAVRGKKCRMDKLV